MSLKTMYQIFEKYSFDDYCEQISRCHVMILFVKEVPCSVFLRWHKRVALACSFDPVIFQDMC